MSNLDADKLKVFTGRSNPKLAEDICNHLQIPLGRGKTDIFSDGELIVRVDEEKKVVERTRTRRQTSSERRRVRRGLPPVRQPGEGRSAEAEESDDDRFDGVEV